MKYFIKITETISVGAYIYCCSFCCHLCMFILFLQENLYRWLYFINILSYGCVYSMYAFDVVCDNKEFLNQKCIVSLFLQMKK